MGKYFHDIKILLMPGVTVKNTEVFAELTQNWLKLWINKPRI